MFEYSDKAKVVLPTTLIVIVIICVALYFITRNKSEKIKQLPFIIITLILLVLEVVKQVKSIGTYQGGSYWPIPLHFCSTFMLWFSFASFGKGRLRELGHTTSVVSGFLFFIAFYVDPHGVIGYSTDNILGSFSSFHTFFYHHSIILFVLLSIILGCYKPKFSHIFGVIIMYSSYFLVALPAAHLLNTNYVSLLSSTIPIMQKLLDNTGYFVYSLAMYAFGICSAIMLIIISIYLGKLIKPRKKL